MSSASSGTITLESYLSSVYSSSTVSSNSTVSSSTDGCVECSNNSTTCPVCEDDEYCVTTSLTCSECPRTYCAKKSTTSSGAASTSTVGSSSSSSSSSTKVGAIVGGVVGGVAFLAVLVALGLFYYKYYTRKRSAMASEDQFSEKPPMLRDPSNPGLMKRRNRNSAATIQTSTASNILPVAYIPGVTTSSLAKKNQRKASPLSSRRYYNDSDRKSHITLGSSILGEDEEELINRNNEAKSWPNPPERPEDLDLTTAIRAKPKLVQIDELGEEDDDDMQKHLSSTTVSSVNKTTYHDSQQRNSPFSSLDDVHTDSAESSNQSRATSSDDHSDSDSDGSFILDVEMPGAPNRIM